MLVSDDAATQLKPQDGTDLEDVSILCIDCQQTFVWTAGEQCFFRDKHLENPPKRCKDCKKEKNKRLAAIELAASEGRRQRIEVQAECCELRMPDHCSVLSLARTSSLLPGMLPPIEWLFIKRNA